MEGTIKRKRNRDTLSCLMCHQRRVKCDRKRPCEACIIHGRANVCTFATKSSKGNKKTKHWNANTSDTSNESNNSGESSRRGSRNPLDYPSPKQRNGVSTSAHSSFADATPEMLNSYPSEASQCILSARLDLPSPKRARHLLLFYMEQLDWFFEAADFDEMQDWLTPFLEKLENPFLKSNHLLKGDATRLALIMSFMLASLQVANENLIESYFVDAKVVGFSRETINRQAVTMCYEDHVKRLFAIASLIDGPSMNLMRANLAYIHFTKNEGRPATEDTGVQTNSISRIAQQCQLHRDPPSYLTEQERQSRRRLFWTYFCYTRFMAVHTGFNTHLIEEGITTALPDAESNSPFFGRRSHLALLYRIKLCRIAGKFISVRQRNSSTARITESIERELQAWNSSLPLSLHSSFPELPPGLRQLRTFDWQRRMLHTIYVTVRTGIHRLSFFPNEIVSLEQAFRSRQICIESAISMIKQQDELRIVLINDHHLRCFFMPYYILESSTTLLIASLLEIAQVPSNKTLPESVQRYMKWAYRARDLLHSLPSDFVPTLQGYRLLSGMLIKASRMLHLHTVRSLSIAESTNAIQEVLQDDQGGYDEQIDPSLRISHTVSSAPPLPPPTNPPTFHLSPIKDSPSRHHVPLPSSSSSLSTSPYSNLTSNANTASSPFFNSALSVEEFARTYFGTAFYQSLANELPHPRATSSKYVPVESPLKEVQAPQENQHRTVEQVDNSTQDEQLDLWLASLQNFV